MSFWLNACLQIVPKNKIFLLPIKNLGHKLNLNFLIPSKMNMRTAQYYHTAEFHIIDRNRRELSFCFSFINYRFRIHEVKRVPYYWLVNHSISWNVVNILLWHFMHIDDKFYHIVSLIAKWHNEKVLQIRLHDCIAMQIIHN